MIIPKLIVSTDNKNSSNAIKQISFFNHQIIVDGTPVETHFDGTHYYWQRVNENGDTEHGVFKLFPHGLMGSGVVSANGETTSFSASSMFDYSITVDGAEWLHFEIGFVSDSQGLKHAFGQFVIPNDPEGTDILNQKTTTIFTIIQDDKKEDVLHVHFDVDPMYCVFGKSRWISGDFNFTMDYSRFTGCVYEYDQSSEDYHGEKHDLKGVYKDSTHLNAIRSAVKSFFAVNPMNGPALKSSVQNIPEHMMAAKALSNEIANSVEDLFTLPVPDMENLHQLSFSKLKALMLYSINDDWRKWFGEKKPDIGFGNTLTQTDADLLKNDTIKNFLNDKFAIGYLTQAFSQSDEPKIKEEFDSVAGYRDKLNYFWKGSGDTCFAKEAGYNLATSALIDSSFVSCVPEITGYLADNPADWAKKLYDYCTTPFTLNGLSLQNTLDGRKRLTHLCSILHALDHEARIDTEDGKKITYATSLYSRVMDVRLNFVISRFSPDNKEIGVEFLTEFFKQYFNSLIAGDKWQDAVLNEAKADYASLLAEYEANGVDDLVLKLGDIVADSMEVLMELKDMPLPARINQWAKNNPKISAALGRTITIAIYGFGIYASIQAFMGWKELKPQEKVQAVVDIVGVTANIFNDAVKFAAASKLSSAQASLTDIMQAGTEIQNAMDLQRVTEIAGKIGVKVDVELVDLAAPGLAEAGEAAGEALVEAGKLEKTATKWMSFSKVSGAFAQGMTILALGAACVCTGFQVANDFSSGQPVAVKVLDIMEVVANGVAFLAEAGAGLFALVGAEVCSVIPVIGIVAALTGIVIAVISLFVHRDPPPTPEETFVSDHSIPFINGILNPPQNWLDTQNKVDAHLDGTVALAM